MLHIVFGPNGNLLCSETVLVVRSGIGGEGRMLDPMQRGQVVQAGYHGIVGAQVHGAFRLRKQGSR